jgi:hypothetical protein
MAAKPNPINGLFMTSSSLTQLPMPPKRLTGACSSVHFEKPHKKSKTPP